MKIDFRQLTITSIIFGFLLIPIHESGHVICDWITGHPASMSYARDYLLSGGNTPFLGLLGGTVAAVDVVYRFCRVHLQTDESIILLSYCNSWII